MSLWALLVVLLAAVVGCGFVIHRLRRLLVAANGGAAGAGTAPPLAGLVDHDTFDARLLEATQACDRDGGSLAVLFINIDGFGRINESMGHAGGDAVLAGFASRLQAALPPQTTLSRLGGDEFLVFLQVDLAGAQALAQRLLAATATPIPVSAGQAALTLSASLGVATYPLHGAASRLVQQANDAMRDVKRCGGGGFAVFDARMAVHQRHKAELLAELRHAIGRGQLELVYQPKVDARTL